MMSSLSDNHAKMLAASGITPKHAALRGYETISDPRRLGELRIAKDGQRTPGLLVPLLKADGSRWGCQYRPDHPRERRGQTVKYETPYGQHNHLDVPPGAGEALRDPTVPLWITEGSKKADCASLHGLCCVSINGVWGWRGQARHTTGYTTTAPKGAPLIDWDQVPLTNRRVILAFDGDVARKPEVRKSCMALSRFLTGKGAKVEILQLPDTDEKTGLDDYLVTYGVDAAWRLVGCAPDECSTATASEPAEYIDGADLLDQMLATLKRYVVFANDSQAIATTLWIAATHAIDAWQHATRLVVKSPQKRCGKSRLLDLIAGMCHRKLLGVNATPPALFRSIGRSKTPPTIVMDEADAIWGTKRNAENNEDLRALFNAGFQRNRPALRCVGQKQEPTEFDTFAMVAFASIKGLPDTIMDRAVIIDLQRRQRDQEVARFRLRRDGPRLDQIREALAQWISANLTNLADAEPQRLPVEDRAADAWEPLVAVADLAGGRWPELARMACRKLAGDADDEEEAQDILLLDDIRKAFKECAFDQHIRVGGGHDVFARSQLLVNELRGIEESPWKEEDLTVGKLAKRLRPFKVAPEHNPGKTARGYWLSALQPVFSRYLRPDPSSRPEGDPGHDEYIDEAARPQGVPNPSGDGHRTGTGHVEDALAVNVNPAGGNGIADNGTDSDGYSARTQPDSHCSDCRVELETPESIARGLCAECALSKLNSEVSK